MAHNDFLASIQTTSEKITKVYTLHFDQKLLGLAFSRSLLGHLFEGSFRQEQDCNHDINMLMPTLQTNTKAIDLVEHCLKHPLEIKSVWAYRRHPLQLP